MVKQIITLLYIAAVLFMQFALVVISTDPRPSGYLVTFSSRLRYNFGRLIMSFGLLVPFEALGVIVGYYSVGDHMLPVLALGTPFLVVALALMWPCMASKKRRSVETLWRNQRIHNGRTYY